MTLVKKRPTRKSRKRNFSQHQSTDIEIPGLTNEQYSSLKEFGFDDTKINNTIKNMNLNDISNEEEFISTFLDNVTGTSANSSIIGIVSNHP